MPLKRVTSFLKSLCLKVLELPAVLLFPSPRIVECLHLFHSNISLYLQLLSPNHPTGVGYSGKEAMSPPCINGYC